MLNRRRFGFPTIVALTLVSTLLLVFQPHPIPAYSAVETTAVDTAAADTEPASITRTGTYTASASPVSASRVDAAAQIDLFKAR